MVILIVIREVVTTYVAVNSMQWDLEKARVYIMEWIVNRIVDILLAFVGLANDLQ